MTIEVELTWTHQIKKGGELMRFGEITNKYPDKFIIVSPVLKNAETNKPITFKVLQTCETTEACEKAMEYYDLEGFENVIPIPNFKRVRKLNPKYVARMFRVMYGTA